MLREHRTLGEGPRAGHGATDDGTVEAQAVGIEWTAHRLSQLRLTPQAVPARHNPP